MLESSCRCIITSSHFRLHRTISGWRHLNENPKRWPKHIFSSTWIFHSCHICSLESRSPWSTNNIDQPLPILEPKREHLPIQQSFADTPLTPVTSTASIGPSDPRSQNQKQAVATPWKLMRMSINSTSRGPPKRLASAMLPAFISCVAAFFAPPIAWIIALILKILAGGKAPARPTPISHAHLAICHQSRGASRERSSISPDGASDGDGGTATWLKYSVR